MRRSGQQGQSVYAEPNMRPVTPRSSSGRHRRRTWLITLLALIAGAALFASLLIRTVGAVRDDLEAARSSMERGRDQLLAGRATAAAASFEQGRELFSRAADRTRGPIVWVFSWLPAAGRTADAVNAIAEAGAATAGAAGVLAGALNEVPGGPAGLAPTEGGIPIDRIRPLADAAEEADALMTDAVAELRKAPDSLLIGPVAPARRTAEEELTELRDSIHATSSLLQGLPGFLGADGPTKYFFGAQNPAELRGTGGLIGAYSILTIDEGTFGFSPFASISLAATLPETAPPDPDYAANYNQFREQGHFWNAINVMPDFPSVSRAILDGYQEATGTRLDGVILADPFALSALLEATGPVEIPGYGARIDGDNVVAFTTNEAYSLFRDSVRRKRVLGDAAEAALEGFIAQPSNSIADLELLLRTMAERHILAYSEDPLMQEGLLATPVGGALRPPGADANLLSVAVSSAAGSKVDYYQQRTIRHSVVLRADGSASEMTDLLLRNHAPTSGEPRYVIGPFKLKGPVGPILKTLEAGESVALVNVYCGTDCIPRQVRLDGAQIALRSREDLGVRYVQHYYAIPSGEERALQVAWEAPHAWQGNSSGGTFRMTFANQVTIRPAHVRIVIAPPVDMHIVSVSSPMRVVDGSAVYEGVPGSRLDLEVTFAPSLPVRLWRNFTRFLTTPVF